MRMGNGVVFAVAGSKGGVGKTTTSINLSAVLAETGYDVALVEMDLAMANVGDFLDLDVRLEGDDPTLHEVLAGNVSVVDATYEAPGNFDVVPSGATLRGYANADVDALSGVLSTLRFAYDVVVVDTGAGVMPGTVVSLALADETVLVSSPRVASVRDTMKTRDLTRQVGGTVAGVVFVRSGTGRSPGVEHISDFLSVDLLGHVPEDGAVARAQDTGRPVVVAEADSDAAEAYRALGECVSERVEALGATRSTVLSAETHDSEGSGFAFVDSPEGADTGGANEEDDAGDTNDADGANEASDDDRAERPTSVAPHVTNGHVSNGRTANGATHDASSTRTNGRATNGDVTGVGVTPPRDPADDRGEATDETATSEPTEPADGGEKRADEPTDATHDAESDAHVEESGGRDASVDADDVDAAKAIGATEAAVIRGDSADATGDANESGDADMVDATGDESEPGEDDPADATGDESEPGDADMVDATGDEDEPGDAGSLDATGDESEPEDDDPVELNADEDGTGASGRSTPRRLIDRAIGLVERRDD